MPSSGALHSASRRELIYEPGAFTKELELGDRLLPIVGVLFNRHFYSESSAVVLSGKQRLLVTGAYRFDGRLIELCSSIVGDLVTHADILPMPWRSQVRACPQEFVAFAAMKAVRTARRSARSAAQRPRVRQIAGRHTVAAEAAATGARPRPCGEGVGAGARVYKYAGIDSEPTFSGIFLN